MKEDDALVYKKGNDYIFGKTDTNLFENQIISFSLTRLEGAEYGSLSASFSTSEIRGIMSRIFKKSRYRFYKKLRDTSKSLLRHMVCIDLDNKNYSMLNLVRKIDYKNSVYTIYFDPDMTPYMGNLKKKYTIMDVKTVMEFSSNYTFHMYEICMAESYKITPEVPVVSIDYDLYELKFALGVISFEDPRDLKDAKEKGMSWKEIASLVPGQKYTKWSGFRARVLEVARKELDAFSPITFDYKPIRGCYGKFETIRFLIRKNEPEKCMDPLDGGKSGPPKSEILGPELEQFVGHNKLEKNDLFLFMEDADYDRETVADAIRQADNQEHIYNYIGWIRDCIRKKYAEKKPIRTINGESEKADRIYGIMESVREEEKNPESQLFQKMWRRFKDSGEYPSFLGDLSKQGIREEMLDLLSEKDKVESYVRWKTGEAIF